MEFVMHGMMEPPVIILNFKSYKEATGEGAERLAMIAEKVSKETGASVLVAVQSTDIYRVASKVSIPVLAQHVDARQPGSWTGHVTALAIKSSGAVGSLVNHSERRLVLSDIAATIEILRSEGLVSILCTDTPATSAAGASLNPEVVAVEPPELIGTGISVSTARPEIVSDTVASVRSLNKRVMILCGAGVSNADDVRKSIELGADGVLLASAFVKASDPYVLLKSMCEAAKRSYERRG